MDLPNTYLLISCSEHLLNAAFFFFFFYFYFVWTLAKCSYVCLSKNCSVKSQYVIASTQLWYYIHTKKKKKKNTTVVQLEISMQSDQSFCFFFFFLVVNPASFLSINKLLLILISWISMLIKKSTNPYLLNKKGAAELEHNGPTQNLIYPF